MSSAFFDAQENQIAKPNITLKWAPTGFDLGSISLQGEYNFGGKNSLTAKIGLPVNDITILINDGNDADFQLKATAFLAGYRTVLVKKSFKGFIFRTFL